MSLDTLQIAADRAARKRNGCDSINVHAALNEQFARLAQVVIVESESFQPCLPGFYFIN